MDSQQEYSLEGAVAVWKEIMKLKVGRSLVRKDPDPGEKEKWLAGVPWALIVPPCVGEKLFFTLVNRVAKVTEEVYPALAGEIKSGLAALPATRSGRRAFLHRVLQKILHKDGAGDYSLEHSSEVAGFLAGAAAKVLMRAYAQKAKAWFSDDSWQRGICPVCGSHPSFSELEGESRIRKLYCDICGTRWRFSRIGCPFCEGNVEEQKLFVLEGVNQYRIYVCDNCRSYLKTVDARFGQPEDLLVENIRTVFLDQLMTREGYGRRLG